jgi:hypothetical protein
MRKTGAGAYSSAFREAKSCRSAQPPISKFYSLRAIPNCIASQVEGAALWGLSLAMYEKATLKDGGIEQTNFDTYTPLRMSQVPEVAVNVIANGEKPTGVRSSKSEGGSNPSFRKRRDGLLRFARNDGGRRLRRAGWLAALWPCGASP